MINAILPFITALALSGIAAYYSVIGLAQIFPGSYWPIVIMGSVLEVAKLVTVSWVYNNWKTTFSALKLYFLIAVVLLMAITSMGIFGYLSKAHIEHSSTIAPQAAKVEIYEEKIKVIQSQIERNNKNLSQYDEAVDQIMGRSKDEKGAERANQVRKAQQKDRERIIAETKRLQKEIQTLTEEKLPLSLEVKKAESDLGPIKYVAEVVYGTQDRDIIDKAVRLVIFIIIIVFDPLAVLLLIAANQTYKRYKEDDTEKQVIKKKKNDTIKSKWTAPNRSLESFFVDDNHEVIPKDKIANIGEMNERT
jgi:hypothetical protein